MKRLLFVGGGIETVPGVQKAKAMGLEVWVSDRNPQAACFSFADQALIADTYDPAGTLDTVKQRVKQVGPIHGCLCLATDVPHTVAVLNESFNLNGVRRQTAAWAMHKRLMKERFQSFGLPIPGFTTIGNREDLARWVKLHQQVVLKPVDSRGARGVLLLDAGSDLQWAIRYSRSFSPSGELIAEVFLDGPQLSTESLVLDGQCHTVGFSDRNYALLEKLRPHIVEDGGELPSALPAEILADTHQLLARAAQALGLENGVLKGDIVIHNGKPTLIEVATRLSGGYFCSHEIPYSTGVDFLGSAIRLALGEKLDPKSLTPQKQVPVVQRYLFPNPGRVEIVADLEPSQHPNVFYREIRVKPGDVVAPIHNHPTRAGLVMATGLTREEAIHHAEAAVQAIHILTAPENGP